EREPAEAERRPSRTEQPRQPRGEEGDAVDPGRRGPGRIAPGLIARDQGWGRRLLGRVAPLGDGRLQVVREVLAPRVAVGGVLRQGLPDDPIERGPQRWIELRGRRR